MLLEVWAVLEGLVAVGGAGGAGCCRSSSYSWRPGRCWRCWLLPKFELQLEVWLHMEVEVAVGVEFIVAEGRVEVGDGTAAEVEQTLLMELSTICWCWTSAGCVWQVLIL